MMHRGGTDEDGDDQKVLPPHWANSHSAEDTYSSIYLVDNNTYIIDPMKTPEEKRLVKKFDRRILPLMCIITFIQFADKMAINYAVPLGLREDTGLSDSEFSTLAALFYVGFLCYQIPNNYCLQYIPLGIYISTLLIAWGTVLAFTSMCTNFEQLAALRLLLGIGEGGVYPCLALLVSTFYRRSEQTLRLGTFWLCNGFAIAFSGFIHYGIAHIPAMGNVHGWMWCMIILGCTTVSVGIVCLFTIIDDPRSLRWHHNAEEQELVEERAKDNAVVRTARVKYQHMWEAAREVRFWLFCMSSLFVNLLNGAMTNYSVSITESFGFHGLHSIVLQVPSGFTDIVCVLFAAWLSQRTRQTLLTACGCLTLTAISLLLVQFAPGRIVKLIGLYLCWSYAAAYVLILASISNNVCGYTKKIFYNGSMMIFYTAGNIIGPFLMLPVANGLIVYIAATAASTLFLFLARRDMANINRHRSRRNDAEDMGQGGATVLVETPEGDLTDKQDPHFVYRL